MSQIVMITVIGASDRPGIVAALTGAVYEAGGNLDDVTMTRLHGAFANMLAARIESEQSLFVLREKLAAVSEKFGLITTVEPIPDDHEDTAPDHQINVYGADKPGIVYEVASLLAELQVNITDLDTRLAGSPGKGVYVMLIETSGGDWEIVPKRLSEVAVRLGVELSHHPIDAAAL